MKYVDPPFELGETLSGKDDSGAFINQEVLGKVFEFPAIPVGQTAIRGDKRRRTGRPVCAIAMRNTAGSVIAGKRVVSAQLAVPTSFSAVGYNQPIFEAVDGYSGTAAESFCCIVDEFLGSGGVADDDIFWGIVSGPVTVTLTAGAVALVVGDVLLSDGAGLAKEAAGTEDFDARIGYSLEITNTSGADILINAQCSAFLR